MWDVVRVSEKLRAIWPGLVPVICTNYNVNFRAIFLFTTNNANHEQGCPALLSLSLNSG